MLALTAVISGALVASPAHAQDYPWHDDEREGISQPAWELCDDSHVAGCVADYTLRALVAVVPDAGVELRPTPGGMLTRPTLEWSVGVPIYRPYLGHMGNDRWPQSAMVTHFTRAPRRWPIGTTYVVVGGELVYLAPGIAEARPRLGVRQTIELAGVLTAFLGIGVTYADAVSSAGISGEAGVQIHLNTDLPRYALNLRVRIEDYPAASDPLVIGLAVGLTAL